ncbi:MAG: discoidin domain-containing protein, partial [Bacteroidaceae bacterium]|nr:discoidin domain-containing protein [Bacteroidaceae bacterium]
MKHKFLFLMTALFASSVWAQVPKADLLDVVFNEDGTATDVSDSKMTVETFGSPFIVKSAKYGINVLCMRNETWSKTPTSYFRVDYEENADYLAALADGHTLECLVRPYWDGDLADVECKPFSSHQGGGTGFLICKKSGARDNEFTFLPNVSETGKSTWRWANSGVVPQKGVYYHIVGVYDKANAVAKIYVNGELKNTIPAPGNYLLASSGNNKFIIGGDPGPINSVQGLGTTSWQGDVAMARVYSEPLTDEQVAAVYESVKAMDTGAIDHRDFDGADGKWTFEKADNLLKPAEGILQLQPISVGKYSVNVCETLDEVGIVPAEGPTAEDKAVFVPRFAGFLLKRPDDSPATKSYTIMMDIKMEDAVSYNGLIQTNRANKEKNDGDLFISENKIGMRALGGYFGEILDNTWYRIALTNSDGAVKVYVNGEKVINKETDDGRWEIDPWGFYLFCDEDEEMVDTYVSEITFWETPLTDEEISALGGFKEEEELQKNEEGIYEIGTANQLAQFASIVNAGEVDANAVLMKDIDMGGKLVDGAPAEDSPLFTPIGTTEVPFAGEFDGQGHVIKNLVINTGVDYTGLFGRVTGTAVIKNFIVDSNSYIGGNAFVGVVGGTINGASTVLIDRIGMEGKVVAAAQNAGGIFGCNMNNPATVVSNCYVTGPVIGARESGQINGWLGGGKIENCWAIGTIEGVYDKTEGAGDGFYRGTPTVAGVLYSNALYRNATTNPFDEEDAKSGKMTFALNGNNADGAWHQTLGVDTYPTLNPTSKKVYAVPTEGFRCDGVPQGEIVYTNEEQTPEIPAHEYEGYICKNCGQINPDFVKPEDGVYSLSEPIQLAWFADMVNSGKTTLNAKLVNDIDMTGVTMSPIGSESNNYRGTFDGQFYTISNFSIQKEENYIGLFGVVSGGATIKNFTVTNAKIAGTSYIGIIGGTNGSGTVVVDGLGFEGESLGTGRNVSGIIGVNMGSAATLSITNCYVIGKVIGNVESAAITGWTGGGVVANCWTTATVAGYDADPHDFYRNNNTQISNSYNDNGLQAGVTLIPEGALESGELTYLLNEGNPNGPWHQTIGEDAYPTLLPSHGVVYKDGDTYINSVAPVGYFTLLTENSNQMNVTQVDEYEYNILSTGGDPYVSVSDLPRDLTPEEVYVMFEYKSSTGIPGAEFFFANTHNGFAGGVEQNFDIPASDDWKVLFVNIADSRANFGWGSAGGNLRLDTGTIPGLDLSIRNITIVTAAQKEAYESSHKYYEIATAADLVEFANAVNAGDTGAGAELTADIDMAGVEYTPAGIVGAPYTGIFNGKGHKISNLVINKSDDYAGLFGVVGGGVVIKNLTLDSTCSITGTRFVGVIGGSNGGGTITIDRVANEGSVSGTAENVSGIIGVNMSSAATFKITNVYSTGTITGKNESAAISGWTGGGDIQNAYSISSVTGLDGDNTLFRGSPSFANVFDINGKQGTAITAEQVASGELAYKFNEAAGKTVLYQKIGEDAYPTFDASRGEVYTDGKGNYFNASLELNEKNQYEISNSIQLVLFSELVNSGATSASAVLTADIDMSNVPNFTPIGLYSDTAGYPNFTYHGVFDGQGHIIRNLTITREDKYETGLFSRTQSATVMNLGVENATITNTQAIRCGVFGGEMYISTIKNLFSVGEIVINTTHDQKGGIAGEAFSTTLQNCYTVYGVAANNTNVYSNTFQGDEVAQGIATGELCFKLNGGSSDNPIYFQTLGEDAYPVLTNTSKVVFQDGETYTNEYPAWYLLKELIAASKTLAASTKIINETALITNTSQFSSNCAWDNQGSLNDLLDGSTLTFFHSTTAMNVADGNEYMDVALNKAVSSFVLEFSGRGDGAAVGAAWHDTPDKIRIYASKDGENWVEITTQQYEIANVDNAYYKSSEPVELGDEYSYVRFNILHTTSNNAYWNVSEFQMYETALDENSPIVTIPRLSTAVADLEGLAAAKTALVSDHTGTQSDINELQRAYDKVQSLLDGTYTYDPTDIPEMSTADNIVLYTIKNCRSGKYVSYAGDDTNMLQTPEMTENSYFYFVADGETVGKFTPVKIYNVSAGKAMDDFASWGLGK